MPHTMRLLMELTPYQRAALERLLERDQSSYHTGAPITVRNLLITARSQETCTTTVFLETREPLAERDAEALLRAELRAFLVPGGPPPGDPLPAGG